MSSELIETHARSITTELHVGCRRLDALSGHFTSRSEALQSLSQFLAQCGVRMQRFLDEGEAATCRLLMVTHYLRTIQKQTASLSSELDVCESEKKLKRQHLGELQVIKSKLNTLFSVFDYVVNSDINDLFNVDREDERWHRLQTFVRVHIFSNPEDMRQRLQNIVVAVSTGSAFVAKAYEHTGQTSRKLVMGLAVMYYSAFKQKAVEKTRLSIAQPSLDVMKTSWSLLDSKLMAGSYEKSTVSITVNQLIFVPRIAVNDVLAARHSDQPSTNCSFSFTKRSGDVGIRILSPMPINALERNPTACGCLAGVRVATAGQDLPKAVIFHIHGGGFIAMSSRSHQGYTRQWANLLQTVVFSVDYRLAPEHPYPAALEDVWSAYLWVLAFAQRDLSITPETIVVTGDSAGGNLVCGLISRAIESGVPRLLPRGAMLTYPALSLSTKRYTPSFDVALEELVVPHTFLKLCVESYARGDAETDFYLSPLITPDEILRRFPPTRIMVGNSDPFEDDCWRFTERLIEAGADVRMVLYDGMPHGFLGFDPTGNGMLEAHEAIQEAAKLLRDLLHSTAPPSTSPHIT